MSDSDTGTVLLSLFPEGGITTPLPIILAVRKSHPRDEERAAPKVKAEVAAGVVPRGPCSSRPLTTSPRWPGLGK